jgi:transcriptional regulator with XRE-family HTH domain
MANSSPSDVVAARVRQVRIRRGLTVAELAERCKAIGAPKLTAQALYKLEGQRQREDRRPRPVTVDELLALALALNVAPVHLLVPVDGPEEPYQITETVAAVSRFAARGWIRGIGPLSGDRREFDTEVPENEYYSPPRQDAPAVQGRWMRPEKEGPDGER